MHKQLGKETMRTNWKKEEVYQWKKPQYANSSKDPAEHCRKTTNTTLQESGTSESEPS